MKKPVFIPGEIYHVYNRGVEKRNIFVNDRDRERFLFGLKLFNTPKAVNISDFSEVEPREWILEDELIEILVFVLMPNHFHLLIREKQERGIISFMQKLGTGYTMYFNKKYERVGPLFQGKFKAVLVKDDSHFRYLPHYIHFNPLDMFEPQWRENRIKNVEQCLSFLKSYKWGSYQEYIGERALDFVKTDFIFSVFDGSQGYIRDVRDWFENLELGSLK